MISVIVPFRDSEIWLGRCLNSLHSLTGDFEFLIVDDNSQDNGIVIAENYAAADERFRVFRNERGPGVSGARNTGLDHANGEWVTFLDADDLMLEEAGSAFMGETGPEKNIIQFNHLRYYTGLDKRALKYTNAGDVFTTEGLPKVWFGVWNKLIRRSFIGDIRFNEDLQYGEDGLFVLELLAKDGTIYHAQRRILTVEHRFDNNSSLSRIKTPDDIIKQIRAYEAFLFKQEDKALKIVVCNELASLWNRIAEILK